MDRDALSAELAQEVTHRMARPVAVREAASLTELGLDSADVLELVADVEDRYGVAVPLDELARVRTFGQMVDHVHQRLA
jgi:acyl carrier protein